MCLTSNRLTGSRGQKPDFIFSTAKVPVLPDANRLYRLAHPITPTPAQLFIGSTRHGRNDWALRSTSNPVLWTAEPYTSDLNTCRRNTYFSILGTKTYRPNVNDGAISYSVRSYNSSPSILYLSLHHHGLASLPGFCFTCMATCRNEYPRKLPYFRKCVV